MKNILQRKERLQNLQNPSYYDSKRMLKECKTKQCKNCKRYNAQRATGREEDRVGSQGQKRTVAPEENRRRKKTASACLAEKSCVSLTYDGRTESHEQLFLHANWK